MSIMPWSNALDIKVELMNNEHKMILNSMNKLHDSWLKKSSYEQQNSIIAELTKITLSHFSDEEAYMAKIEFPNLAAHKLIHKDLLTKYQEHVNHFQKTKNLSEDFFIFLKVWLTAHIQCIDIKYSEHSKKQAA